MMDNWQNWFPLIGLRFSFHFILFTRTLFLRKLMVFLDILGCMPTRNEMSIFRFTSFI